VYRKALEVVEEGRARGSLTLKGLEKRVEVGSREHVVKVIDGGAEFDVGRSGRKLLRIKIAAEVDGTRREYAITFGRYGTNAAVGFAMARADAPGGREEDAERFSALIKALTGKEPRIRRMKDGTIMTECYGEHLDGFKRYAELADAIEEWLEETSRRWSPNATISSRLRNFRRRHVSTPRGTWGCPPESWARPPRLPSLLCRFFLSSSSPRPRQSRADAAPRRRSP